MTFESAVDRNAEDATAIELEAAWRCELHRFGLLAPVDFYAERDGRMTGAVEIKCRTNSAGAYPTVFLSVRKWVALTLVGLGLGVPALFVVRFTDGIRWIPVSRVDTTGPRIAGRPPRPGARHDREPVIDVPVAALQPLERARLEP
jgi:hypothetical protein